MENENEFFIFIKRLIGKSNDHVIGKPQYTVLDLKNQIKSNENVDTDNIKMIFKGREIHNDEKLCDLNIIKESVIHLVIKNN